MDRLLFRIKYDLKKALLSGLLLMVIFSGQAFASGAKTVTMKKVAAGKYTNTVRVGSQKYVYHKITIKSAGFIRFSAKSMRGGSGVVGLTGTLVGAGKKLKDRKAYPGGSRYLSIRKHEDAFFSVRKGTYYFRVSTLGMAGYTYKLNAVFTKKIKAAGSERAKAVKLKAGKSRPGMFWFDGFKTRADDSEEKYRWFRFKAEAGKKVKIWYWSNYYAQDLFFDGEADLKTVSTLENKSGKTWRVYTVTPLKSGWQYLAVLGFTHPGQEKMFTLMLK